MSGAEARFGGIARLYGKNGAARFRATRVAIVGLGGVGSWAAEALARSGVGHLLLMDLDDICITNTNRQLHTAASTIGKPKTAAMAERLRDINPDAAVETIDAFYTASRPERLFEKGPDLVVDAIDAMQPKAHLLAACRERGIPVVTCGGAGGRVDPSQVRVADLARSHGDNLLSSLRRILRKDYGFPLTDKGPELGMPCVFSPEKPRFPQCDGTVGNQRDGKFSGRMACDAGFGAATHVTGVFGFMMAGKALDLLLAQASGKEETR